MLQSRSLFGWLRAFEIPPTLTLGSTKLKKCADNFYLKKLRYIIVSVPVLFFLYFLALVVCLDLCLESPRFSNLRWCSSFPHGGSHTVTRSCTPRRWLRNTSWRLGNRSCSCCVMSSSSSGSSRSTKLLFSRSWSDILTVLML